MNLDKNDIFEGECLIDCLQKASDAYKVTINEINYQLLQSNSTGFFGFGAKKFIIKVTLKNLSNDKVNEHISNFQNQLKSIHDDLENLKRLEIYSNASATMKDMMDNYHNLDDALKKEVDALALIDNQGFGKDFLVLSSTDGKYEINVWENFMGVELSLYPPKGNGKPVNLRDIILHLKNIKLKFGLDSQLLKNSVADCNKKGIEANNLVIATGRQPINGKKAWVEYFFDIDQSEKINCEQIKTEKKKNAIVNYVKKGDIIAIKHSPTKGENGLDVLGNEIFAFPGDNLFITSGKNVLYEEQTSRFIAEIEGIVKLNDKIITIDELLIIQTNVNMESGDINFEGAVIIEGSVLDGLSVVARDDIEIKGSVEGARIHSKNGSITIKSGIAGRNRGYVSAEKNLYVKYIENATVLAKCNIEVQEAVMHSQITAGKKILVTNGKGSIIGGVISAGNLIEAKTIGSRNEIETRIHLGINLETLDVLADLNNKINSLQQAELKILNVLEKMGGKSQDPNIFPDIIKKQYIQIQKDLVTLKYTESKHIEEKQNIIRNSKTNLDGRLVAHINLYRKTFVQIGEQIFISNKNYNYLKVSYDKEHNKLIF